MSLSELRAIRSDLSEEIEVQYYTEYGDTKVSEELYELKVNDWNYEGSNLRLRFAFKRDKLAIASSSFFCPASESCPQECIQMEVSMKGDFVQHGSKVELGDRFSSLSHDQLYRTVSRDAYVLDGDIASYIRSYRANSTGKASLFRHCGVRTYVIDRTLLQ